jgi:hypothetical protein
MPTQTTRELLLRAARVHQAAVVEIATSKGLRAEKQGALAAHPSWHGRIGRDRTKEPRNHAAKHDSLIGSVRSSVHRWRPRSRSAADRTLCADTAARSAASCGERPWMYRCRHTRIGMMLGLMLCARCSAATASASHVL